MGSGPNRDNHPSSWFLPSRNSIHLLAGGRIFDAVARLLVENPQYEVEVQGHTDSTGSLDLNLRLSQQRADSVMASLISKGVAANPISAKGYGPNQPIADDDTAEGRAQKRRVDLVPTY